MKVTDSIEYYASCPQCGAPNTGNMARCEYCDALLIKKTIRETENGYSNMEYQFSEDDMILPEVKGHFCGKNTFLVLFTLFFGGMFLLVPTIICITFVSTGIMEPWLIAFFALFWLIGIGSFVPLIVGTVRKTKCKNGEIITAEVRGYEDSMIMINNRPEQMIRLKIYEHGTYKMLILNTGETKRKYPIGFNIRLRHYKNNYMFEQ